MLQLTDTAASCEKLRPECFDRVSQAGDRTQTADENPFFHVSLQLE